MTSTPLLNISAITRSLRQAAATDGLSLAPEQILESIKSVIQQAGGPIQLEVDSKGDVFAPLAMIFEIQMKWAPKLASDLSVDCSPLENGGWLFLGMPALTEQLATLRMVACSAIATLDEDALSRFGYRVTDVYKRVVSTGEDQHQVNARVFAERVGLHQADQPPGARRDCDQMDNPASGAAAKDLTDVLSRLSTTSLDARKAAVESPKTEGTLEQAAARLHHRVFGLRPVK